MTERSIGDVLENERVLHQQVQRLRGYVQAVRELHREVEGPGFTYCAECDRLSGGVFGACVYPCSTARALGVEG